MSIFVDKVITRDESAIQVEMAWHKQLNVIAIGSYSEEKGGCVEVIDQHGYTIDEGRIPFHPTAQTSCLAWHPTKKLLIIGWESGELYLYAGEQCLKVDSVHTTSIHIANWSSRGSCLITGDRYGSVVGWKSDGGAGLEMIFHHELKDTLTSLSFCVAQNGNGHLDQSALTGLARAAVAGDEKALDLFSSWRPFDAGGQEINNAYAGSSSGTIFFLHENGSCMEVLQADGAVKKLLMTKKNLVVVTENMIIGQFHLESDGGLREVSRVKLSTRTKENHISWVDSGHLAISSGELNVRVWNLENDHNLVLTYQQAAEGASGAQFFTCLGYSHSNRILAAGTNSGLVTMWHSQSKSNLTSESSWRQLPPINIGSAIRSIAWGFQGSVLALNTIRQVFFLSEQQRAIGFHKGVTAVQSSPSDVQITFPGGKDDSPVKLATKITIEIVKLAEGTMVVYGNGKVLTYELQQELRHVLSIGDFDLFCEDICVHDQSVCTMETNRINIRSFPGTIKQTLLLADAEGIGSSLNVYGNYLLVSTKNSFVKVWDMSKRDLRLHTHPVNLKDKVAEFSSMGTVKMNAVGTFLSITSDSRIYILDFESSSTHYFNFNSGRNEREDATVPPNSAQSSSGGHSRGGGGREDTTSFKKLITGQTIVHHAWDEAERNFLVCQTRAVGHMDTAEESEDLFVSMFYHEEVGLIVHDSRTAAQYANSKLVGVAIPFIYLFHESLLPPAAGQKTSQSVIKLVMKDFEGIESSDSATKEAVINFCFYLSIGNMDEAFRSIKTITNKKVWGNLARMCVKSQRLDVAMICLGKMEHAVGARAMRRISATKVAKDIKVAILAIYLNMHEEAEEILLRCGHYELLNKFYQDSDNWQKALDIAEKHDRIHVRSTCYNYAKHLENKYDIGGAIAYYEKSGTGRFEIPRLLFEDWNALESYVDRSEDKSLKRWLAQYLESTGEMDAALQYYELAEDYLSLVRVYCYCEKLEKAAEIANSSGNKAACYHLARQYENMDDVSSAIHFFSKAQAYANAIRICKEHKYDNQVWNLALLASDNEKLDAAKYFEKGDKPQYDKAVILYEKAGYFAKALELAIATNQHNALVTITKQLKNVEDPFLSARAASFFLDNKQYEKAVDLFIASHQCEKALELCLQYNITITEESAEKLALDSTGKVNNDLLNQVASVCYRQGNYHLATKKWTQAGNRLQAMKALLKSGDTEKIIFFANVSRDKDIYILAGNYLQTLDWRNNAEIMKSIILFYQKGKALDLLGWFYQACADVEIDEYQNYEKALGALSECMKCLEKSSEGGKNAEKIMQVGRHMDLISKFVNAQQLYDKDPAATIRTCQELLRESDINQAVRKGDLYGFLIEHYAKVQNFKAVQQMLEELQRSIPNVNLAYYINNDVLLSIERALGVSLVNRAEPNDEGDVDEEVE